MFPGHFILSLGVNLDLWAMLSQAMSNTVALDQQKQSPLPNGMSQVSELSRKTIAGSSEKLPFPGAPD